MRVVSRALAARMLVSLSLPLMRKNKTRELWRRTNDGF